MQLSKIFILTLVFTQGLFAEQDYRTFLPSDRCPIPLSLALPDNYTVAPTEPEYTHVFSLDISRGVLWGTKEDIDQAYKDWEGALKNLQSGLFRVTISSHIPLEEHYKMMQNDRLVKDHISAGMKVMTYDKFYWGDFPVIALTSEYAGLVMKSAWVGVPYSQSVLHIAYFPSKEEEVDLWKSFLEKTKPLERKDYLSYLGAEMEEGWSRFSQGNTVIEGFAEQEEKGQIKLVLTPRTAGTTISVEGATVAKEGVKVQLTTKRNDPTYGCVVTPYIFTISPKQVTSSTLSGEVLMDSEEILIMSHCH